MAPRHALTALALALAGPAGASDGARDTVEDLNTTTERAGEVAHKGLSIVALPIPSSDPTLGTGLTLPVLLLYDPVAGQRPWMTGVGAMYTTSDSWGVGAFQKAYLMGDRLRLTASVGHASLHLNYYGTGSSAGARDLSVPIVQKSPVAFVKALWKVADHVYAGVRYHYLRAETEVRSFALPGTALTLPGFQRDTTVSAFGLAAEYDTRDSEQNPRAGTYATASIALPREATGSTYDFDTAKLAVNHYRPLGAGGTLALRAALCATGGDVPYFSLCQFGSQGDLRGYEAGRYRDRAMLAAQAEYRWTFHERWGAVVFGGAGGVGERLGEALAGSVLPSAGFGVRWQASRNYGINLAGDMAWGRDGNRGFYLRIGEAF